MTKPTGVREIIEGIETKQWDVTANEWDNRNAEWRIQDSIGPGFDSPPTEITLVDKVVAIALELEKQRNLNVEWPSYHRDIKEAVSNYNADLLKITKGEA